MNDSKAATQTVNPVRVPLYKGVRCVTFVRDPESFGMSGTNYFDVPHESFTEGNLTGIKIAYEIMAAARKGNFDAFESVHKAAFRVIRESKGNSETASDGAGAAVAYLQTMTEILELAAQKLDLSNLMQDSFFNHEAMMQDTVDVRKAENLAFIASMQEAEAVCTA